MRTRVVFTRVLVVLVRQVFGIIGVASYAGLSRSEIEGLTWENYSGKEIAITRAVVHGKIGEPKTKQRKNSVPVIARLKLILDQYRLSCGNPAKGVMFANSEGQPTCLNNLVNRAILPVLNRCAVCRKSEDDHGKADHKFERDSSLPVWHGYHACRRALATNLHDLGIDDLTIQKILRHASVKTTQACYIKTLPKQVTDAMDRFEVRLNEEGLASNWPVDRTAAPANH